MLWPGEREAGPRVGSSGPVAGCLGSPGQLWCCDGSWCGLGLSPPCSAAALHGGHPARASMGPILCPVDGRTCSLGGWGGFTAAACVVNRAVCLGGSTDQPWGPGRVETLGRAVVLGGFVASQVEEGVLGGRRVPSTWPDLSLHLPSSWSRMEAMGTRPLPAPWAAVSIPGTPVHGS